MAELNEVVAEVADEVADSASRLARFSRALKDVEKKYVALGFAAGAAAGAFAGYWVAFKRLDAKYMQISEDEISMMRDHFNAKVRAAEPKPTLVDMVEELGYTPREMTAIAESEENASEPPEPPKPEIHNIFKDQPVQEADVGPQVWDYATEVRKRTADEPYIIHTDEFTQNEKEYEQSTVTYFAEDDVLCDERDEVITDKNSIVGDANLDNFGHGSGDPNVVYVRNDHLEHEWEIIKQDNSYAETVHGFVKHSAYEPRRRGHPRFDDE